MDESSRRGRLRSFALGGIVGAAGALATARRLRGFRRPPSDAPAGLAAFEDAPCYREHAERAAAAQAGGETARRGSE